MSNEAPTLEDAKSMAYAACRVKDEVFWVEQERNIQGALGQPCCTLSGIASSLMNTVGHFAVVIHGEDECAACFRHVGPAAVQFFCTGLTEQEFVTGRTAEPLRRCLELIIEEMSPDAIFVLGACPVEIIGDDFPGVVRDVSKSYPDLPILAMRTSGLKVGSQTAMLDWLFEALASLPTRAPANMTWRREVAEYARFIAGASAATPTSLLAEAVERIRGLASPTEPTPDECINFVGLPRLRVIADIPEHERVIAEAGLALVGSYPRVRTFEDWQRIRFARHSFFADRSLYPKLTRRLEESGQRVVDVPLPIGVAQTREVYEIIGRCTGRLDKIQAAIAPLAEAAEQRLAAFRARFGGLRMAYAIRMNNNYDADELAYQGLGDFFALSELGLDMTLLVQGPPDKRDRFEKMFERRNIRLPFEMFLEPWVMADLLAAGQYDVAYLADHCRNEAAKAKVPMIPTRTLEPWFDGAIRNLDRFEHMLRDLAGAHGHAASR
jgi:nitrogenase molybdenum-iron protein alpha/beta subunit